MAPMLIAMSIGPLLKWRKDDLGFDAVKVED